MYRQHPAHRMARELVAAGALGRVKLAKAQMELAWRVEQPGWYFDPGMAGGGVVYMAGVHRVDLLRYMLGSEIDEVRALVGDHAPDRPYEESALALLRFDDGARGILNFNLDLPHGTTNIELHGEAGSIILQDTMLQWWGGGGGELILKNGSGTVRHAFEKPDLYRAEVEDFNRSITDGRPPAGTGADGLRAAAACSALFESGRSGCAVRPGDLLG
jgi:1,5-anhydro-D-fructose reductase (1,5-anhydro-D-mannitol-forming)